MGNTFGDALRAVSDIASIDRDLFVQTGLRELHAIFVALLMMIAATAILTHQFDVRRLLKTVYVYLVVWSMLTWWTVPSPIFGVSTTRLFTDEAQYLSNILDMQAESTLFNTLATFRDAIDAAHPTTYQRIVNFGSEIRYWVLELIVLALGAIVWFVVSWGFVAQAMLVIIGPVMVPFLLVPGFEWAGWGWVRSFFQYALYPVAATCYVLIAARILTYFAVSHPPPYTSAAEWSMMASAFIIFCSIAIGALQIPSFVSSMVSGRAGESAVPKWLRASL